MAVWSSWSQGLCHAQKMTFYMLSSCIPAPHGLATPSTMLLWLWESGINVFLRNDPQASLSFNIEQPCIPVSTAIHCKERLLWLRLRVWTLAFTRQFDVIWIYLLSILQWHETVKQLTWLPACTGQTNPCIMRINYQLQPKS